MCEYGPCTCEYGHIRSTAPTAMGFLVNPSCIYNLPGATRLVEKYASHKIWPAARKPQQYNSIFYSKYIFFGKFAIFQSLMRGTARQHGFLHIGANLVTKGLLGKMGQIHPFSTCIERRPAISSKYGVSCISKLDYV